MQPRSISFVDANQVTFRTPNNATRWALEVSESVATNYLIEEWVRQQRSYLNYYNGTLPATDLPAAAPVVCNRGYPGALRAGSHVDAATGVANGTQASAWFSTCFDYFTAEYYDKVKADLTLKGSTVGLPGANFYDVTLKDALLVVPLTTNCAGDLASLTQVSVLGRTHCNWAVDANAGHTLGDLFAPAGVALNSWNKTYGKATLGANVVTAGSPAQAGLPQQLRLTLVRHASETAGVGSLSSAYGAWTATSTALTSEVVNWQISADNPNMVLISLPFRDVNDPRVKSNTTSGGLPASTAPVLAAAHFSALFAGNTFRLDAPTHTATNTRKLALVLQDGVFMSGQYYGAGHTFSERNFSMAAMEQAMQVMNYILAKLYGAGFTD